MSIISGIVASGRGNASGHITSSMEELSEITGKTLYPGSLNVVLDEEVNLQTRYARSFDSGKRFVWEASVDDHKVWLYRWRGAPFNIVELLADIKLREVLGLVDGGRIHIDISDEMVGRMRLTSRVSTFVLWGWGRKHLYYNGNYASNRKVRFIRRLIKDGQR